MDNQTRYDRLSDFLEPVVKHRFAEERIITTQGQTTIERTAGDPLPAFIGAVRQLVSAARELGLGPDIDVRAEQFQAAVNELIDSPPWKRSVSQLRRALARAPVKPQRRLGFAEPISAEAPVSDITRSSRRSRPKPGLGFHDIPQAKQTLEIVSDVSRVACCLYGLLDRFAAYKHKLAAGRKHSAFAQVHAKLVDLARQDESNYSGGYFLMRWLVERNAPNVDDQVAGLNGDFELCAEAIRAIKAAAQALRLRLIGDESLATAKWVTVAEAATAADTSAPNISKWA